MTILDHHAASRAAAGTGPEPESPGPVSRGWRHRGPRAMIAVITMVLVAGFGVSAASEYLARLDPFATQTVDHSPAPLLVQLRDVAQYRAATGTFQVLVDIEHDTANIPAAISGERTTLFATGTVDALVDFSDLGTDRVTVSADRRAVTIALPAPVLGSAALDPAQTRIIGRERGLVQRIGAAISDRPVDDQPLYTAAAQKLDTAAGESDLAARAQQNTRSMLSGLAGSLGYTQVTVTFAAPGSR